MSIEFSLGVDPADARVRVKDKLGEDAVQDQQ